MKIGYIIVGLLLLGIYSAAAFDANSAYAWLRSRSVNGGYNNNVIDTSAAILALGVQQFPVTEEVVYLDSQKNQAGCWPGASCRVKDTAFAVLALKSVGADVSDAESWLYEASSAVALDGSWLLQVKTQDSGTCTLKYRKRGSQTETIRSIAVEAGRFPGCNNRTWLDIGGCVDSTALNTPSLLLDVECPGLGQAIISLVFRSGQQYHVIKTIPSTTGAITVPNACFGLGYRSACNFEATAYAGWALSDDSGSLYLQNGYDESNIFHNAILALITANEGYKMDLKNNQAQDGGFGGVFNTALAILALEAGDEATKAKDWLKGRQLNDGSWGSVLYTGFALYALADEIELCPDWDRDGICDEKDTDKDGDSVPDSIDKELFTPTGCDVNLETGIKIDFDNDGICNGLDECDATKPGCNVDDRGCPLSCDTAGCVGDPACECPSCSDCFDVYGWICTTDECSACNMGSCFLEDVSLGRDTCEDCSLATECATYDFREDCTNNPCGDSIGGCFWNETICCNDADEDQICDEGDPCPGDSENVCIGTCTDSKKNRDERGVDCGGVCEQFDDCCNNRVQDDGEEGVDCGGVCDECRLFVCGDDKCESDKGEDYDLCPEDCLSSTMLKDLCSNGRIDTITKEEGVDCGGLCNACEESLCVVDEICSYSDYGETKQNCPEDCLCGNCDHDAEDYPDNCPKACGGCGDGICDINAGEDATNCPRDCAEGLGCNNDNICDVNEDCSCADCKDTEECKKKAPWLPVIIVVILGVAVFSYYFLFYKKGRPLLFKKKPKERPAYRYGEKMEEKGKPPVYGSFAGPGAGEKRGESRTEKELKKSIEEAKRLLGK